MQRSSQAALLIPWIMITLVGCDSSRGPKNAVIESEFRHAWHAIHGEAGEKGYGWKLQQIEIGGITVDHDAGTAKVSLKFTYQGSAGIVSKTGDFEFRRFGDKWEIDDRDAKSSTSSTRFQMTP